MSNPNDDTGVPSGLNDDAEMERTSTGSSARLLHRRPPPKGRASALPGPPNDRPPQSASVEERSRLA